MQNEKFVLDGCDFVEQCVKSLRSLVSLENCFQVQSLRVSNSLTLKKIRLFSGFLFYFIEILFWMQFWYMYSDVCWSCSDGIHDVWRINTLSVHS